MVQVVALTTVRLGTYGDASRILAHLAQSLAAHAVSVKGYGLHVSDDPTAFVGIYLEFAVN